MARRSRRPVTNTRQRDTSPVARTAAASRSLSYWTDLPQSRPELSAPASVGQRPNRHRFVAAVAKTRQTASRPFSFGAWSLPPTLSQKTLQRAVTCVRRGVRREVLFATRGRGKGSHARKKYFSNRSCK